MARTAGTTATLRRVPAQERSRRHLETILDAAALVFSETGFDAATMDAVAVRAGTSIGSLYRFFPNKRALFRALVDRNLARARVLHQTLLTPEALERPWPELVDAVIDGFDAMKRDPGFRATALNLQVYGLYEKADDALHREFIRRTDQLIARKAPRMPAGERRLVATMLNHVIAALLFFSEREDPRMAKKLIAETKVLLRRYLEPHLGKPTT